MPITILKNSTKSFTLSLVDNEGYTYTYKKDSIVVVNDNPELGDISFDQETLKGVVISKDQNGELNYRFQGITLQGKAVHGADKVFIVDEVPAADANRMVALYSASS
jgi:hypothetical protein